MKNLQKMAPMHFTVPITRVDKETREVEGYAFVNEVVPGEGGIRLTRKAMQAATEDYMEWAAVREMHQPSAVGKALEARWDEKGLIIRAKIVDDKAWEKVEEGVYKAYSVGVKARVMRGKDVTVCDHFETSLVDRPKDKDCSLFRIDGDEESDCEIEAEDEAPEPVPMERGVFADQMVGTWEAPEEAYNRAMARLNPTKLTLVGVQAGRVALLRGTGMSKRGPFPKSVNAHVPDAKLFTSLSALRLPCDLMVVLDNEGTVTPVHLIEAEVITAKAESAA